MSVDRSALPVPGPAGSFHFPRIERHALNNGLEVRTIEHRAVPIVSAVLLLPGGTSADPAARPGLTAFTADLLDEGSDGRSAIEVSDALARAGADLDVEVGADAVVVGITMLTRYLPQGLALLAEMVTRPDLAEPDIERVRKLRLERLQQLRDHASAVAERAIAKLLYGSHPYGHLGLGSEAALTETTAHELRAWHRGMFVPRGATLVLAGDLEGAALVAAADKEFGSWKGSGDAAINRDAALEAPPATPQHRAAVVARPGAVQSELRLAHVCASRRTPDYHALLLLNTILGGPFVSRVNMKLRQEKGYTYGVRTGFDLRRGLGPFTLQTSVQTEVTAAAVRDALAEIEDIRAARPATPDELESAQAWVTRGYARGFETAQQVARGVAHLALHDLPDSYFADFVPLVNAVALSDVHRTAAQYLDPSRLCTLAVGDYERIAPGLTEVLGETPATVTV